jgi:hypothetical protein
VKIAITPGAADARPSSIAVTRAFGRVAGTITA